MDAASQIALNLRLVEFWVLFCTALVLFMQAGFCSLESGLSRSKNSIDVAIKNLIDFCLAGSLYWACGYALMFGPSWRGLVGTQGFFFVDSSHGHWPTVFFLFQLVYCGTAITISSGAAAERMRFIPYFVLAALGAGIVYPVFGHWVWAGLESDPGEVPVMAGWLARLGFVDFAGSTVVHSLGAWVALAAVVCIGPRSGRFPIGRAAQKIQGHNLPMSTLGLFILWLGWFGFNGGRTFAPNEQVPLILVNTLLAGVFGGLVGLLFPWAWHVWRVYRSSGAAREEELATPGLSVEATINGVLSGLVAISAGCNVVTPPSAVAIGAVASLVMHASSRFLELGVWRWHGKPVKVDDVVGAIPAHGFAGAWGTLAVPLFSPIGTLPVQCLGMVVCFAWAFGTSFAVLSVLRALSGWLPSLRLRLSQDEERQGLNYVEYKSHTEFHELLTTLEQQLRASVTRVSGEPLSEIGMIARLYNQVVEGRVALEHARREAEFQHAVQNAAQQANRAKSEFLALMSHEIRTPMTSIVGFTNVLLESLTAPLEREHLDIIKRNGEHLLSLIDDILDLSKIEAGKLEVQQTSFSPAELLHEVYELMSIRCREKVLSLRVEHEGPLPTTIRTDRKRLRQILLNLVGNAIKFTEAGSVLLQARASWRDGRAMMRFDVVDTGIGIGPDLLSRLFQPFTQENATAAGDRGGTGLGLAISKRLALLLGGDISVVSAPRQGSTFTLSIAMNAADEPLPVQTVSARSEIVSLYDSGSPHQGATGNGAPSRLDCHILLAEDGKDNQRLIAHLLRGAGAEVTVADNGQAAVERTLAAMQVGRHIDLVLMDMRMPELDGYDATRQLRSAGFSGPIIALTAYSMEGDRQKCLAAGCDDFAPKPLSEQKLLGQIRTQLARSDRGHPEAGGVHSALADHPLVGDILPEFLAGMPEHIATLEQQCQAQGWVALYESAHQLKGALGNYGYHQATPVVQQLLDLLKPYRNATDAPPAPDQPLPQAEINSVTATLIDLCRRLRSDSAAHPATEKT